MAPPTNSLAPVEKSLPGILVAASLVAGFLLISLVWAEQFWQTVWTGTVPLSPLHHYTDDLGCLITNLAQPKIYQARHQTPVNAGHCGHTQRNKQRNGWRLGLLNFNSQQLPRAWPAMGARPYCGYTYRACRKIDSCVSPSLSPSNSAGRSSGAGLVRRRV